ncbi:tetratricopeptide repeat protein [Deltaproteobacteria bacterium OttesenSCG-928-K17]|nr:tetratricopeptide repeat protein [Deltaproteobacteria bacterium OttesenSCG-928-K17]
MTMIIKRLMTACLILALTLTFAGCISLFGPDQPGSSGSSKKTAKRSLSAENEAKVRSLTNLAAALLMEGEHTKALNELLKAKEIDPNNADIENYLGLSYYGMKQYGLAAESYTKALSLAPGRTDIHNNMGLVYLAQSNYDKALEEFNICVADLSYQKKHLPLSNIGLVYLQMGRYDEALASLQKATDATPTYGKAYQLAGRVYLAQNQVSQAIDYLNNGAKLDPTDPETFMVLGDAYVRANKPQEAAEAYSRVGTLAPNSTIALEAQRRARQAMGF